MDPIVRPAVVLDCGTGVVRAGLAGGERPQAVVANAVGRPKHARVLAGGALADGGPLFVGAKAAAHRGALSLSRPMERGAVAPGRWGDMEAVWRHVYDGGEGLGVNPRDQPLLLTEAPLAPRAHRVRAAEVLFESLGVPSLHVASPAVLTLYASGETTGLVVDSGEGVTSVTPVYEGLLLGGGAQQRTDLAGRDVTDALRLHLRRASFLPSSSSSGSSAAAIVSYAGALGSSMHTSAEAEVVRELKEAACYVAKDGDAFAAAATSRAGRSGVAARHGAASSSEAPTEFTLPDGQRVLLSAAERAGAAEVLFNPSVVGLHEQPGVHQAVALALAGCDVSLREPLLGRLHLAGGTTLLRGYGDRLLRELAALTPPGTRLRLAAPTRRDTAAWVGGSIVASLSTFAASGVSRAEWEERGEAAVLSSAVGSAGAV